ncbi:DNA-directed RNA polymerase subunit P (rpoP) [Thermococcus gammatolerans EJ3]|uniref:DNA-directed RNA polymerase subunit Rpo12 n=2 Tax=Thermococcus TaxID=2263 RepID=C5A4Z3_THEGJ|nr:DNA-directed RNA polymerase subunit P (rpoP) [Thermococcus gammatolerans EJ3]
MAVPEVRGNFRRRCLPADHPCRKGREARCRFQGLILPFWGDIMVKAIYRCAKCGREVELDLETAREVRCPYCGSKILYKPRPRVARRVKAI